MTTSTHELSVGESLIIKRGFISKHLIVYAGMPSETCFSLAVSWTSGYNSAAFNLYFPTSQRSVAISGKHFTVDRVTGESITLNPTGRSEGGVN